MPHGVSSSRKRKRRARWATRILAAQSAYPHHPGYWTSTATATPGTSHRWPTGRPESSVAYLQMPAGKVPRDPGYLQWCQPPSNNCCDFSVPKFAAPSSVISQGNPASPSMPQKELETLATTAPGHRSLEKLLNSPVWKLLPEFAPLKPTPPRPAPVTSPLKTLGHPRQRVVPRSLKRTFDKLFGDCSDLDDCEKKEKEEPTPIFTG